MDSHIIEVGGYTPKDINNSYFGIDMDFSASKVEACEVSLKWVWCEIEYEMADLTIKDSHNTTSSNRHKVPTGKTVYTNFLLKNTTNISVGKNKTYKLEVPWGTELVDVTCNRGTFNSSNNTWTVNASPKTESKLTVKYKDYTVDDQEITLKDITEVPLNWGIDISDCIHYYHAIRSRVSGYDDTTISTANIPHKRHRTCFNINSHSQSDDTSLIYYVQNTCEWLLLDFNLDPQFCSDGVSFDEIIASQYIIENPDGTYTVPANRRIGFKLVVPEDVEFDWGATLCMRPHSEGEQVLSGMNDDSDIPNTCNYTVNPPYVYHIGSTVNDIEDSSNSNYGIHDRLVAERVNFINHRIASNLETGAFVLPCKVKDGDASMIVNKPNIHMYLWEQIDYIGCVPLEHLHFDPKSTYKDKLLDNHYKNKRYMGKELASDEDIDLNVRVHPKQVTTLQGLIDMDKPIPINANHRCFEGDSLNHRGWAEIYGITTTLTNPNWYKCSIDVKYLTHNLNTRFKINKGSKTFSNYTIPSLLSTINDSGDAISENQNNDFFLVDTDGTYEYLEEDIEYEYLLDKDDNTVIWNAVSTSYTTIDEDTEEVVTYTGYDILTYLDGIGVTVLTPVVGEPLQIAEDYTPADNQRNTFELSSGQHLNIKSREQLSKNNQITVAWSSSMLDEFKENSISRIIRLIDDTGNSVFEYEYFDFDFTNFESTPSLVDGSYISTLSCQVIGRKRDKGDFVEVINREINLNVDVEANDEDDPSLNYYGSTVSFRLNGNVLVVEDMGYSGKELTSDNIELEDANYTFELEWLNKNTDGESSSITAFLDLIVQDNVLDNRYSSLYSGLYVSPFPVANKKTAFTRNGEEGVIYYLQDDSEEFSYLIDPYYQYHNGVDLRAESDDGSYISIFNLGYGYNTVYLENGLVSLGINRLTGNMFLRKWNEDLKEYVTLYYLHLNKFDDVNINSISDDRIELQASDTTIIMYRGHPYVIFKHPTEDIGLDSRYYKVWGQKVDDYEQSDYPTIFNLMNTDNLLPECVTKKLDKSCMSVSEKNVHPSSTVNIELSKPSGDVYDNQSVTFTVTGQPSGSKVHYLIDGDELGSTVDGTFTYTFEKIGSYSVMAVYVGDDNTSYSVSNELTIQVVDDPEADVPVGGDTGDNGGSNQLSGEYVLTMNCPKSFKYRDNQKITYTLTRGGQPVSGVEIQVVDFNVINTQTTDANGRVTVRNTRSGSNVGSYKLGARYWVNGKIKKQIWQNVKVNKATPRFVLQSLAKKKGNNFSVKLEHYVDKNNQHPIGGKNAIIYIDGDKKTKKTSSGGIIKVKVNKTGKVKYKCVFNGNKNYKSCKLNVREMVKKN